ncbi:MAG TPA: S41 family peptidase [Rhabdochlamydiaceae bacterium]|jgi:carboxyl-terminal processing protease|nr:S41 family peptidase [Rhabdochlamydiaceae bacterium]
MKLKPLLFFLCLLFTPLGVFGKPPELSPRDTRIKVEEILRAHATHHALNQELVQRSLQNFFRELDPTHSYLLEPEIIKWTKASPELLTATLEGFKKEEFTVFEDAYEIMIKAIERRRTLETKIGTLTPPSDVDGAEFKDMTWAKTLEDLETRILRIKGLQLKTAERVMDAEAKQTFLSRLDKRRTAKEEELIASDPKTRKQHLLSYVLKATSSALDSQTTYFTPSEANQFMMQVQQRLFGIGAQLRDDLNGFTIVRILENSPLSNHPQVQMNDRIIAINNDPVIGQDLAEAVELIRGPKGTSVTLTFLRKKEDKTEEKFDVNITRGEIVLKESRLESTLEPFGNGVIGIVKLFSFYQDPTFASSTDIAEALNKMKEEHNLKGVILDLRNNGGGLINQAVSVSGLFMKKGVVVSVKDNTGFIQKLRNTESNTVWDGPLLILTNKASASAAEIVAQTLQEYGRAIIVGDPETFGKGTFQSFTLEASNYGRVNPKGEYKVTRGRYYTVSGKSPQLVGVPADIVVPGYFTTMDIGEKFARFPLETDQIDPSFDDDLFDIPAIHRYQAMRVYKFDLQQILTTYQPYMTILKKNSEERLKLNKNHQNLMEACSKKEPSIYPKFGQNDIQLHESLNIMKDLLMLMQIKASAA